jgi:uncharacterized protein YndB with AHSA1/START domain
MTVISVEKDAESLTMTIIAQFDAPTTRVWQVWQDPRQLERWWDRRPTRQRWSATTSPQAASSPTS